MRSRSMLGKRENAAVRSVNGLEDLIENLRWLRAMNAGQDGIEDAVLNLRIEKLLDAYEIAEKIALECDQILEYNQRD